MSRIKTSCTFDGVITLESLEPIMDCNAFEHCKWLRHLGKVMVAFVLGIVGVSVWAVVVDTLVPAFQVNHGITCLFIFLLVVLYLYLIAMLSWAYFVCVFTDPGRVPVGWSPFPDEESAEEDFERMASSGSGLQRLAGSSRPRFCRKCNAWKPPRAHHDSVTGRCVLKMDHYCVWVVNTIGLLNYKAFNLFLIYTFFASLVGASTLAVAFLNAFWSDSATDLPILVYIAFSLDTAFTFALAGFIIMHLRLIAANCTTIEMYEKKRVPLWPYDRGFKQNVMEVFGYRILYWFFPVISREEERLLLESCLGVENGGSEQIALKGSMIEL